MAIVKCADQLLPKLANIQLHHYLSERVAANSHNYAFDLEGLKEALTDLESELGFALVLAKGLEVLDHERRVNASRSNASIAYLHGASEFLLNHASNLTRLDGSRNGPVGMYPTGFSIIDNLAAGRMNNAQTLRDQSVQLLINRDYSEQQGYAEDKERIRDPENYVWIIPQRIFVFAHELMGQREGQAKQPWDHWDVIGDDDYIAAARAVYTKDIAEAAQVVCKLCNLHVEYSNPFPEEDDFIYLSAKKGASWLGSGKSSQIWQAVPEYLHNWAVAPRLTNFVQVTKSRRIARLDKQQAPICISNCAFGKNSRT